MACIFFQTDDIHANIIDDIKNATIPLVGIRVDFEGEGINNPQPTCDEGAEWHFKSTQLGQTEENICSGDTFKVNIGTAIDNSFIMAMLEYFLNTIITMLNWVLDFIGIHISPVDFSFKYDISFSNVPGWQKPGKITSYITLVKFKPIKYKKFCIPYWLLGWREFCFDLPIQFGMSHKAEYQKLKHKCYQDADNDSYGDILISKDSFDECDDGWVDNSTDCDDTDPLINPGIGSETRCNNLDDDCDGEIDEGLRANCYRDLDSDGCGDPANVQNYCKSDGKPSQCVDESCDCDDTNPNRYAGNDEIKCDDIDQDCNDEDDCPGEDCMTISNIPLETLASPAPPLIVFVIDDSGSMDQDIMTEEKYGDFHVVEKDGEEIKRTADYYYVFYAADNVYSNSQENASFVEDKYYYQPRWYEYNRVYYKPTVTYDPWPKWDELDDTPTPDWAQAPDANPKEPRSNPMMTTTIDMNATFVAFDPVNIKRSHYFVFSELAAQLYLVNIDIDTSNIDYYQVDTWSNHKIRTLNKTDNPPEDVRSSRTFEEELQNFANWFSFYRKRMHTTKAAIGSVIDSLEGVKAGILTINDNKSVHSPVLPIKCKNDEGTLDDQSETLLNILYQAFATSGTPLRKGLEQAGQYFTENSSSTFGDWPFASEDEGGECQQVFSVVLTDGWWNGNDPSVNNADGDNSSDFDTVCFQDSYDNTLADVAMYYYENDLSDSLANKVPPRSEDINTQQHMVTFSVSFGLNGSLKPFDDYPSCPLVNEKSDCSGHCPEWPEPISNDKTTIDDLWHAAVNGRGEYFSASNPQDLILAMEAIGRQISVIGSAASVAVNGQKLEHDSLVFQGSYNSSDWSGDLRAFGTGGSDEFDFDKPVWSARDELDDKNWEDRVIITSNGGRNGILFNELDDEDLLERIHKDEDMAKKIMRYVSGDDTDEQKNGGSARTRYHKLGDIVHSHPLFFKEFVFIGANDGMGHVFVSETGEEAGAYVPNLVFENLAELYSPEYTHKFYCDATPTIKETDDGSYLVGGLGRGGRGYYCLNVSESEFASMPKWEFPPYTSDDEDDDVKMGYSYSTPFIVKSNYADKWVVIFGNGYGSKRGKAALYIRDLKTGDKIATLDTHSGSYDICNGMSSPALIDVDFDGAVDYAFAGDMIGNLWKFDLTSDNPDEWKTAYGTPDEPQPLFQAKNAEGDEGTPQPITTKPDVMTHCVNGKAGYIVVFGTGRYITEGDTKSMNQQTLYGIWDWQNNDDRNNTFFYGSFTKERELSNAKNLPEDYKKIKLLQQEVDSGYSSDGYKVITDKTISWYPTEIEDEDEYSHVGWYFDLPTQHERIIDNPMIREGKVIVISLIPATSKCGIKSHSSMYILDACNGGRLSEPVITVDDEIVEIEADAPGGTKLPPSAIDLDTVIKPPAFIHTDNGTDRMIFGDLGSDAAIPQIEIDSEQGRFYWKF